ncbi:ascorbic acid mannose pathway regulator [Trema orientale]|uniref:Ascorbic acid mannose pathway regulator n=1 Tax=Trema orientale TaxID=63057 RepID=A0A2P5AE23_TREOI|nr:ascorbic acid mannose pathway regulator [Trema orientale]
MLLVPSDEEHTWSIYNVIDDKLLNLKLSLSHEKRFSGSSQGWLVVVNEDHTVTLYKPHFILKDDICDANTSIQLPYLFPPLLDLTPDDDPDPDYGQFLIEVRDYHVWKALITADPVTNPDNCIIVVIYGFQRKMACIIYGKDKTWKEIEYRGMDMVHFKNQIYIVRNNGELISFDPCNGTIELVAHHIEEMLEAMNFNSTTNRYLVESCGELLQIERYVAFHEDGYDRVTKIFRVFKLDFDTTEWIEIKDLGNVSLFIGDNSSISSLATEFNGWQKNCIYFTHDEAGLPTDTNKSCDLGVYNLESESFKLYYNLDSTTFQRMYKRPPIWIIPLPNGY